MKKSLVVLFFSIFLIFPLLAQRSKPDSIMTDKRIFLQAEITFNENQFGDSLLLAEQAKVARRNMIDWEIDTLENSFKSFEVKRAGDSLTEVNAVLVEREDYEALNIIKKYVRFHGMDFFKDSKEVLLSYIKNQREYPEADYLIGRIYRLEGEYDLAFSYMKTAYENAAVLDIPDEQFDILYSLADISFTKKDFDQYEKNLLLIIGEDSTFKDKTLISAMKKTMASPHSDCLEKFFMLYRSSSYRLLKAYFELSDYYSSMNEHEKSLEVSAIGVITGFSKILDVVKKRDADYEYTDFDSLLKEAAKYPDIVEWGIENEVWKGFNVLAENAYKNVDAIFAIQLFKALNKNSPEEYWKEQAGFRLEEITMSTKNQ